MLFAIKRHLVPTLLWLVLFGGVAIWVRAALGLEWSMDFQPGALLLGMAAMAASDALLHGMFSWALGERYLTRYRELVEYFRPQGARQIIAGGLLAGSEELVFRGVILEGLRSQAGLAAPAAIGIAALAFGVLHAIPSRPLVPFALWATWEGAVLGMVYVLSGSLVVVMVLHILHDIIGFSLFAYQRRTGWLLG